MIYEGCGKCCGPVPIPLEVWIENQYKVMAEPVEEMYSKDKDGNRVVFAVTKDLECVFLTPDKRCAIYDQRPDVCRIMGTDKLPCPIK